MGESLLGQQVGGVCLDLFRGSTLLHTSWVFSRAEWNSFRRGHRAVSRSSLFRSVNPADPPKGSTSESGLNMECMAAGCSCQLFERYTEKAVGPRHHVILDNKLFEIL